MNRAKAITITCLVLLGIMTTVLSSKVIAEKEKVYVLKLRYDKGNISLLDVFIKQGYSPDRRIQPEIGHRCDVVSFSGEILYTFKFSIPNKIFPPPPREGEGPGGVIYLDKVDFPLLIPYFTSGGKINIYDENNVLVLSVDISEFATKKTTSTTLRPTVTPRKPAKTIIYLAIGVTLVITLYTLFARRKAGRKES